MRNQPKKQLKKATDIAEPMALAGGGTSLDREPVVDALRVESAKFTTQELRMVGFARRDLLGVLAVILLVGGFFSAIFYYDSTNGKLSEFSRVVAKATGLVK